MNHLYHLRSAHQDALLAKNHNRYDYLIVGSGLFGATIAYRLKQMGKRCLVIEKRSHLGGNVYCHNIAGINIHKYGAHIFHTSNKDVWDFVNSFVPFNNFTNTPIADYKGKRYNLPFNMNTFKQMWGVSSKEDAEAIINEQRESIRKKLNGAKPRNLEEQALLLVGKDIYETIIKEYTEKQWGRSCAELPAFIIKRLPLRFTYNNNYFDDTYQGVPIGGYNKLIEGLLQGIECKTNCDFFKLYNKSWRSIADRMVYTGPLDEYFDYCYGMLDWRSVCYNIIVKDTPDYQGNAVINYTSKDVAYTRIIEHKHFETFGEQVQCNPQTVISEEYSVEYKKGMEPFYPINNTKNESIANKYRELAMQEKDVIFGGRLADYHYYDMSVVVEQALNTDLC